MKTLRNFTDLIVWQKSHKLVLRIYKLVKLFPREEQFGLSNQLRRSAVSITSNIAEGFGRRGGKEKAQFYSYALSSSYEAQNQIMIARDVGFISLSKAEIILEESIEINKVLNTLIKRVKSLPRN